MAAQRMYLANATPDVDPSSIRGAWDQIGSPPVRALSLTRHRGGIAGPAFTGAVREPAVLAAVIAGPITGSVLEPEWSG